MRLRVRRILGAHHCAGEWLRRVFVVDGVLERELLVEIGDEMHDVDIAGKEYDMGLGVGLMEWES